VHVAPSIDGRDNSCKFRGVNGALCKNVAEFAFANCIIAIGPEMRFDRANIQGPSAMHLMILKQDKAHLP
jgi:hypothetical protein